MRYSLYTYSLQENFSISQSEGVFGAPKNHAGLQSKVLQLRRDDIIIIRDGRKRRLSFFGHCAVVGDVFDHNQYSPSADFLWRDEQAGQRVIYPLRVAVDFIEVPELHLETITWHALDELAFVNKKGVRMVGKQAWGKSSQAISFRSLPR
jgi:hypothetical protein